MFNGSLCIILGKIHSEQCGLVGTDHVEFTESANVRKVDEETDTARSGLMKQRYRRTHVSSLADTCNAVYSSTLIELNVAQLAMSDDDCKRY